ncbi:hypothetical protein COCON_G00043080 [Conger conger]|uniref:Type I cytokine receptor cytokine-binding domain-containing protein n=1 Tax=Conger conger TaxID=82655 RepID=A0A9Q1I416_CONCO|nr:interleukin-13 receptor subunit alpha-2 [Conger conger]KAJ8281789.1 hypothetical protein COCON_G00043080 [Conger conger]
MVNALCETGLLTDHAEVFPFNGLNKPGLSDSSRSTMAGALGRKHVWTLMAGLVLLVSKSHAQHEITVDPPWNIQIIDPGYLGQLNVTWALPKSLENRTDCAFRFQLQFFNTYEGEWTTIRTREQSYSAQFDLEKDVHVRLQTIVMGRCGGSEDVMSPAAEVLQRPLGIGLPGTKIKGFQCIFYEKEYMDCSWTKGHKARPQAKYHLYFWHRNMKRAKECPQYLYSHGHKSGCKFSWNSLLEFTEFNVCVNGSLAGAELQPAYFTMQLQNHVKPGVINTLSLETRPKGPVSLEWAPPKGRIPAGCLEFEVESTPEVTEGPMVRNLTRETSFTVSPSVPCKTVCYRVRSRVHEFCSDDSFWSDWSHSYCLSENCKFTSNSASNKA